MTIETEILRLIPCDAETLKSAIAGNDQLAKRLGVTVADNWTEFGVESLQYSWERLLEDPINFGWWTYFPVHKQDNKLIGSGGYKGSPTDAGTVEVGYEIAAAYRNKGLATELINGLISNAFADSRIKLIIAHTLGAEFVMVLPV
jgi:RimJ/RimL family protein N-acetyltransferase